MISFVWSPGTPLPAGTGGTENYTVGQVRELCRRGVDARVVTVGVGTSDGREGFPGVPFVSLAEVADVADLEGAVIFVGEFPHVRTITGAFQMLHVPPPALPHHRDRMRTQVSDRILIATSRFAARLWAEFLDVDVDTIAVVHPFAEHEFAAVARQPRRSGRTGVLYAGRLSPEKGIFTLLSMLHHELLTEIRRDGTCSFTVTRAGDDKPQGRIIRDMVSTHPGLSLVDAASSPTAMADLMSLHDIVVMPSNAQYWHETFGIVSLEAQHAGCRVVASDDGGLPETDCGAITLVTPDDAAALAAGISHAIGLGAVPARERVHAGTMFTAGQSVDSLLDVLARPHRPTPATVLEELEILARLPPSIHPPMPHQERAMTDKSPRQHLSKKSGKSLKQKRADKRASTQEPSTPTPGARRPAR